MLINYISCNYLHPSKMLDVSQGIWVCYFALNSFHLPSSIYASEERVFSLGETGRISVTFGQKSSLQCVQTFKIHGVCFVDERGP